MGLQLHPVASSGTLWNRLCTSGLLWSSRCCPLVSWPFRLRVLDTFCSAKVCAQAPVRPVFVQPAVCGGRAAPPEPPLDLDTLKGKPAKCTGLIYGVQLTAATAERKHQTLHIHSGRREKASVATELFLSQPTWKKTFIGFNPSLLP